MSALTCGWECVGHLWNSKRRAHFEPLVDMVGGGPFDLRAGEWTYDTSMALCLAKLAGAFYGASEIPQEWLSKLAHRELITSFADLLYAAASKRNGIRLAGVSVSLECAT